MELDSIICGDAVEVMKEFEPESIDLTVTSPPYGNLRTYNGFQFNFEAIARELYRVTKHGGVVVWIVGDEVVRGSESLVPFEQAIYFKELGFWMHDTMIYHKRNFSHPEKKRCHQVFEFMFVLSKGKPKTFNPITDKPNSTAGKVGNFGVNTFTQRDGSKSRRNKKLTAKFGMRGNVWTGKTRGQEEVCKKMPHPAMMPMWLAHDHIVMWSNPGDIVLDPMCGGGTVLDQAKRQGRHYIGIDVSQEYVELARTLIVKF